MSFTFFVDDNSTVHYAENGVDFFSFAERINESNGIIELSLSGSFRSDIVPSVQDELLALASLNKSIRIDMKDLIYISNAAQESLLFTQQHMDETKKGAFVLTNLPSKIYHEFESIGLTQLLAIE